MMRFEAVLVLLILSAAQLQCTFGPGLSTPEERANVVARTQLLEQDPLGENAPATRQWLRNWIVEVPDIRVYVCEDLLGHGLGDSYPYSSEVNPQVFFSAAAFAIEHPDKARDRLSQYHAGVQGALRAYEALLKSKPDARSAFLDDLLAKQDQGELADHLAKLADEKCKPSNTMWIINLAGAAVGLVLGLLIAWWSGRRQASRVAGSGTVTGENGSARFAGISQRIVLACAAYFVVTVATLHVLEPDFDPRFRFMSEYALGDYGWLMTINFFVLGLAILVVAAGLRVVHQPSRRERLGFGLLVVSALFVCLAGIFKDSIPHLLASVVVFSSIVIAVLLLSWSFRQAAEWRSISRVALFIALGMLAAYMSMVADVGMPGLQQRAFIFLLLMWLSIVIHRFVRIRAGGARQRDTF